MFSSGAHALLCLKSLGYKRIKLMVIYTTGEEFKGKMAGMNEERVNNTYSSTCESIEFSCKRFLDAHQVIEGLLIDANNPFEFSVGISKFKPKAAALL